MHANCLIAEFFSKLTFSKNLSEIILLKCQTVWLQIRPDLSPYCLQRISADCTGRQRIEPHYKKDGFLLMRKQRRRSAAQ